MKTPILFGGVFILALPRAAVSSVIDNNNGIYMANVSGRVKRGVNINSTIDGASFYVSPTTVTILNISSGSLSASALSIWVDNV